MSNVRRVTAVTSVVLVLLGVTASGSGAASADTVTTYDATGAATGVKVTIQNATLPAGIVIEGSGPTAQAELSSLGTSDSFAALPYPGDTAANLPGTVTALTQVPLPDYPMYVHSENGGAAAPVNFPGAELSAETSGYRSAARAVAGTNSVGYFADSVVQQDSDGSVAVHSVAQQNGLDAGGKVTVSGVIATASANLLSSGRLKFAASMVIGRIYAPGLKYTVPTQFCIPSQSCQSIPAPFAGQVIDAPDLGFADGTFYLTLPIAGSQKFPVPAQSVLDAFKGIGVDLHYEAAVQTKTSIIAPTLSMRTVLSPPNNPVFNGPTPVTYTFGLASASLDGSITDTGSSLFNLNGSADGNTGLSALPTDGGALPAAAGTAGPVGGSVVALPPSGGALPPAVAPPSETGANTASPLVVAGVRVPLRGSVSWFYLVFVGVALAGTAAGQILRYVGVRASWTS